MTRSIKEQAESWMGTTPLEFGEALALARANSLRNEGHELSISAAETGDYRWCNLACQGISKVFQELAGTQDYIDAMARLKRERAN